MGGSDEKRAGGTVREHVRLRPSIADEPSGGYSYHDATRVDAVRGRAIAAAKPANDAAPVADAKSARRPPLSEPPEVGSWPPMPSVPPDLEGAAEAAGNIEFRQQPPIEEEDDYELMPTDPPRSATKVGGAIWEAVPSVIGMSVEPGEPDSLPAKPIDIAAAPSLPREAAPAPSRGAAQPAPHEATPSTPREAAPPASAERMSYTTLSSEDPHLAKLEQLVERSAWEQLDKELSIEAASPALGLLHVIARRELQASDEKGTSALTREAIHHLAALLQVPETSPIALLVAKRLLRRNRLAVHMQPASKGLSAIVVLAGLAVGGGVGWLVTKLFL